jgi:sugar/nucleoside kinase (ribokinase family)
MLSSINSHEMESRAMFDLLVVGDANPDVILSGVPRRPAYGQREELVDSGVLTVGGSGAIMACGAARLGLRTAFVGRVGDDEAGRFMLSSLEARGVDVSACVVDPSLPTALTVVLVDGGRAEHRSRGERRSPAGERGGADGDAGEEPNGEGGGDRAILTAPGCLPYLAGADVPRELLASARHVHAASFFLQPRLAADLPSLFSVARSHGATTSLDTNDDPSGRWEGLEAVLAETDVLLPNEAEVLAIAARVAEGRSSAHVPSNGVPSISSGGGSAVEAAARDLAARGVLPVVKLGRDGVLAWTDAGAVRAPAVAVTPVDTVGAGDSLDAGFVAARLRGLPPAAALRIAAACGSLSTRAAGGTSAQPTWEEAVSAASVSSP